MITLSNYCPRFCLGLVQLGASNNMRFLKWGSGDARRLPTLEIWVGAGIWNQYQMASNDLKCSGPGSAMAPNGL